MMEPTVEKEFTALGGLFQHIISDLKNSAPVWEDFLFKANKFHAQLSYTRAFGDGPRNFESWSSDMDNT
ncbi:UNVERIFIED_CONTAM: Mtss1 [Trichonephila clavipes]